MEQFEIYSLPLFSLVLTNVTFYLMVALAIIIGISRLSDHKLVGNWWTLLNESLYHTLLQMTRENVGTNATNYFPLLFTVFYLILFSNLIGLVPYTSTPTVEMVLALSLAVTLLIGVLITGFLIHGQKLFAAFIPAGTPLGLVPLMILLEILAYLTRTLSLGLRLAVNMTTGHILAKVMIGFIWAIALSANFISTIMFALAMSLITLFIGLEILIAYLQATIFVFITCITFKDMTNLLTFH